MVTSRTKSRSARSTHASRKNRQSRSRHATSRRASRGHSRKHSRGHSRKHSRGHSRGHSRKSKSRKHARKSRRMHGGGVSKLTDAQNELKEQYKKALKKMEDIASKVQGKWKAYRVKDDAMVKRLSNILEGLKNRIRRTNMPAQNRSSSDNQLLQLTNSPN